MQGIELGFLGAGIGVGWVARWQWQRQHRSKAVAPILPGDQGIPAMMELRSLLHQAPVGYLQVDKENQLMWCNTMASRLLGIAYGNQEPTATPRLLLEWVRSYELDHLIEETRLCQTPQQQDWTLNLVSPDPLHPGEGVAYPLRGYSVPLGQGQVGVFLENRQEALQLMQQRDRWTSDVAHELKTPLTSIRLVAETLRDRVDTNLHSWFDRLLNEILRLSNLVEDLLNLSRLESSGDLSLTLKAVDLVTILRSAWSSLEPLAQAKQLRLDYEGPPHLYATLDESLIHRVCINLLDNAIKYSPPEGLIWVRTRVVTQPLDLRAGGGAVVQLEVIDQGEGFKETDLPYVFSRFYRADPARARFALGEGEAMLPRDRTVRQGTGLGLAIVQQIVDAHGGYVTARNHPDIGGGWLTVNFPYSVPQTTPSPPQSAQLS